MAASGDIEIAQNGAQSNIKLHPYFLALIRWCVSSVWSTATLVLHRFMTTPLPPSTAPKPPKPRPASSDHLHPEPKVDCVVLHTPPVPTIDVIFVHGLYGSLGNTWRQGEWRSKYSSEPIIVPLRRHSTCCDSQTDNCICKKEDSTKNNNDIGKEKPENEYDNMFKSNELTFENDERKFYADIRKILPKENAFITEKFYNNTLLDQVEIVGNYETQATFVKDLFEREEKSENDNVLKDNIEDYIDCDCKVNGKCEVGCGCVCDECYSPCWPRDWIKVDYPGARVISINYTSDPYLWRPLWIKESKRLRLHERAEQMMDQLLALGVGERPIIWVGHSKGGLFIKQIYCEAFEAYKKLHQESANNELNVDNERRDQCGNNEYSNDNRINHNLENNDNDNSTSVNNVDNATNNDTRINDTRINDKLNSDMQEECVYIENSIIEAFHFNVSDSDIDSNLNTINVEFKRNIFKDVYKKEIEQDRLDIETFTDKDDAFNDDNNSFNNENSNFQSAEEDGTENKSLLKEEDQASLQARAALWSSSAGFMFYSVPHRGSPLADIKTPITARSVELMEICKDCNLVLSLQERWLAATATSRPVVRSLVETCRTLMSVLWLRIVSVDSADPGIGALSGINVDHREICKPAGRACLLYQELMQLMRAALNKCHVI